MEKTDELTTHILDILNDGYNESTLHRLSVLQVRTEGCGQVKEAETIDHIISSIAAQPVSRRANLCRMAYRLCNNLWGGESTVDDVQDAFDDYQVQELRNNIGI